MLCTEILVGLWSSPVLASGWRIHGKDQNNTVNILKNLLISHAKLTPVLLFSIYLVEIQCMFISKSINNHDMF